MTTIPEFQIRRVGDNINSYFDHWGLFVYTIVYLRNKQSWHVTISAGHNPTKWHQGTPEDTRGHRGVADWKVGHDWGESFMIIVVFFTKLYVFSISYVWSLLNIFKASTVAVAVTVHSSGGDQRADLMPSNKKYFILEGSRLKIECICWDDK